MNFAPQQLAGRYHVAVGPSIQDANGTLMDENSNMIKGEAADTFRGQFVLTSSAITAFPVAEGFESASGDFGGWSFAPGPGTISLTTSNAPHGGANQLFFNTQPTDGASQSATLVVDLSGQSGQTNFFLEFWAKYFLPPGGYFGSWKFFVELSGDGQTWHSIFQSGWDLFGGATNIFPFYTEYRIDLDQASLANGVALDGDVYIRFRHLSTESYFANINMVFLDDVRIVAGNPNVPTLAFPARTTNGQFQFQLAGPVGSNYVIQASTDLITWTPIATNLFTATGFFSITDPSATNYSRRFYRAVLVPRIVLARVTDDFNNGNDAGWSLYAPYAAPSVAFPSGGYRLSGGPGVGAAVKYRPDAKAQDFVTSVDIKNWTQVDQAFGIFSRGAFVAELTGFAFYFIPASGGPDQNILGIVRVDSLTTQPIVALKTGVSLDPAKTYRMVFTGIGPSLTGQLFELTGGAPLLLYTLTGSDASYASGGVNGLVIFDRTGGTGSMDVTFDNFNADQL
ncbi:MAG: hypothetical protein NT154_30875 [Verrucomicrobia bacterium]|nr:hypothetical protein [Verrucomicrobiota bacterium]